MVIGSVLAEDGRPALLRGANRVFMHLSQGQLTGQRLAAPLLIVA